MLPLAEHTLLRAAEGKHKHGGLASRTPTSTTQAPGLGQSPSSLFAAWHSLDTAQLPSQGSIWQAAGLRGCAVPVSAERAERPSEKKRFGLVLWV